MSKEVLKNLQAIVDTQVEEAARLSLEAIIQTILSAALAFYSGEAAPANPESENIALTGDKEDALKLVAVDAWFDGEVLLLESQLWAMTNGLTLAEADVLEELVRGAGVWYSALPSGIKLRPEASLELVRREKDGEPGIFFSFVA